MQSKYLRFPALIIDKNFQVNLPRGSGYVRFKTRADAEKAQLYMDGVGLSKIWE